MEYLKDNQYFDDEALPNDASLGAGEKKSNDEGN